jgi:DNA invertase Pin-like site-specific DNA recombinase
MFEEKASGVQRDRPALKAALEYMREGDTLVVWKLLYSGKTRSVGHC